jgi:hypothetical protein
MSAPEILSTPGGKLALGIGTLVLVAIAAVVAIKSGTFGGADLGNQPTANQLITGAQAQINAIDKMTNLTPEERQAMKAHEEGVIQKAQAAERGRAAANSESQAISANTPGR